MPPLRGLASPNPIVTLTLGAALALSKPINYYLMA